ncbi:hypothetical protein DNTS_011621 [Danionella cerebrum]|uniref:HMG box domain-containing protein n=1 Tax=Danionella cerebrum TaxID=2873325 RepID=A0A553NMQ2_9TELE|nr:hypothetical protein DNTS_011621 [Danionella translucida]
MQMEAEMGLVAGRSQREKRRSYKDLLREEEIIDAEDTELFLSGAESQKKRKHHHHQEDQLYRESQKRKHCSSSPPQTAMRLLEAISSAESPSPSSSFPPLFSSQRQRGDQNHSWGSNRKRSLLVREGLPVVGEEVELEGNLGHAGGSRGSSSADDSVSDKLLILESSNHSCSRKKKKSKKKKQRDRGEPAGNLPKRKFLTAYQIFYKEYRKSVLEEEPGLDFGELSKRLSEAWKQLPEGDKQVWRERSEYLQRKQMKSESIKHHKHTTPKPSQVSRDTKVKDAASLVCASSAAGLKLREPSTAALHNDSSINIHREASRIPAAPDSSMRAPELDPIDAAAHLQLLGESLSVIGRRLQETEGMVTVSGSLSVLLDSLVCVFSSLSCLTTLVPELNGCPRQMLSSTLDNIAYVMPGL